MKLNREGCDHRLTTPFEDRHAELSHLDENVLPFHDCALCSFMEPCHPTYISKNLKSVLYCSCGRAYDIKDHELVPRHNKHPEGRFDWTMKIKRDFITNSSSASYILTLETANPMTEGEFKEKFNAHLEGHKEYLPDLRMWDASNIIQRGPTVFEITEWTSMHNYISDIPTYMRHFIIADYIGAVADEFHHAGIVRARFRMESDY